MERGLIKFKQVIERANKKALKQDTHKKYTLYSDPTITEANKFEAMKTYLGVKGYRPIITVFKEFPLSFSFFSFRMIVLRWRERQLDLFSDGYNYHCIATDLDVSAEEVVWEYNDRVQIERV